MWVITTDGFYSAVQSKFDASELLVRARAHQDLVNVSERLEIEKKDRPSIHHTADADYAYRMFVSRELWEDYLSAACFDIDYPDFKSQIKDHERHNIYLRVWSVLHDIQRGDPDADAERERKERVAARNRDRARRLREGIEV